MRLWIVMVWLGLAGAAAASEAPTYQDFDQPPHNYWDRPLRDPFTLAKPDFESGARSLDRSSEKAFLQSLLKSLEIPASSQMLLFSTTSLQLSLIRPRNPRALFFNEDVYVGYIPGGRIEIVSIDPEAGGIFYIFDIPRGESPIRVERSTRCMNCHASDDTRRVPGLTLKSVVPGPNGGTLKSFRSGLLGHEVPFEERFGGWYVTGAGAITNHYGNVTGSLYQGKLTKYPLQLGAYPADRYPMPASDILPQLVMEHQAGFVDRAIEATYRTRTALSVGGGKLNADGSKELEDQAVQLTRYLLFADEARLPASVEGDPAFKSDFLRTRRVSKGGASLKDFDLKSRLFKHRCSYMIYSSVFQGMPVEMKLRVYAKLSAALDTRRPDPAFAYLPAEEKANIHRILKETLNDLPKNW